MRNKILSVMLLLCIQCSAVFAAWDTVITVSDDCYGRDDYGTTNFGSADALLTQHQSTYGYSRIAYIKFDLSSLIGKTITDARLVFTNTLATPSSAGLQIYVESTSVWEEEYLTWSNAPVQSGTGGWDVFTNEILLTPYVIPGGTAVDDPIIIEPTGVGDTTFRTALNGAINPTYGLDAEISFALYIPTAADGQAVQFASKEYKDGSYAAYLELETTAFGTNTGTDCFTIHEADHTKAGDLNEDCYVDINDMLLFTEAWLGCNTPGDSDCVPNWWLR